MINKLSGAERREKIRDEFFGDEDAWTRDPKEKGWFKAPRTLPLILELLKSKDLSGNFDPSGVYLDLLSRNIGGGLVEMTDEAVHAYSAGYFGTRAVRSWQERMKVLESLGFIKTKQIGNQRYKYVLIVHQTAAVQHLRDAGKVSDAWWDAYRARQIEVKEDSFVERKRKRDTNVIHIESAKQSANG
jgi:hypothetical protein